MANSDIFGSIAVVFILGYLFYIIYYAFGVFQFNPFKKVVPLSKADIAFLEQKVFFYKQISPIHRDKLNNRIAWFRSRKKYVFLGEVPNQHEIKLLLAATMAMLTLGFRQYKMLRSLLRIIVYPSPYYSRINKKHHLGEYNPRLSTLVFSAEHILTGYHIPDDNINLAVHEFAHALYFNSFSARSWESRKFRYGIRQISKLITHEGFLKKVEESNYFRAYGLTNKQEFFAVMVESFMESPTTFKAQFPELYQLVKKMLNFNFYATP